MILQSVRAWCLLMLFGWTQTGAASGPGTDSEVQDVGLLGGRDTEVDSEASDSDSDAAFGELPELKQEIPESLVPAVAFGISTEDVVVGEVVTWEMSVGKHASGIRIVSDSGMSFGKLEIQDRDREHVPGKSIAMRVHLLSFEPGTFAIPPQKLSIVDDQGRLTELMSPAFTVRVRSLIANEPQPEMKADEAPPETVYQRDDTMLWVLGTLALVVLVALLTLLVRRLWSMRKPAPLPPPPPPRPAEEIALEKLTALETSSYLDEGMHKTFHLKLSEAVREYLGNRYGFYSLESSTTEIVSKLRSCGIPLELMREIRELLQDTDLVKFARYQPDTEESKRLLNSAVEMVHKTIPAENEGLAENEDGER